ncbi:hypothetical protein J3F84DRAFT_398984 [Trichoderma pleuroticola]
MQDVRSLSERRGGIRKFSLTRPAHHDESPRRTSLVRLNSDDDKQGKAICDNGRLKGGRCIGTMHNDGSRSLRNGMRASIPSLNEQVAAT